MLNVYEEGDYDHLVWSGLLLALDSKISFPLQEVPFKTTVSSIREGQFNTAASCSLGDSRFVIGGLNLQKHSMDMWSDGKTLYYQVKDGKSVLTSKEIGKVSTVEGGPFFIVDENVGYVHFLRGYQLGGHEKRKLPDRVNIGDLIRSGNNPNFGILKSDLTFEYNGKSVDLHTELTGLSLAMDIGVFQKDGLFVLASPSPGNIVFADPTDIESNRMALNLGVTSQNLVQFHTAGGTKHFLAWVEKSSNKIHLFYASELNLPVFKTKIEEMFSPTKITVSETLFSAIIKKLGPLGTMIVVLALGTFFLGCCYWYTIPSTAVTAKVGKKTTKATSKETSKKTPNKITANKQKQRSKTHHSH